MFIICPDNWILKSNSTHDDNQKWSTRSNGLPCRLLIFFYWNYEDACLTLTAYLDGQSKHQAWTNALVSHGYFRPVTPVLRNCTCTKYMLSWSQILAQRQECFRMLSMNTELDAWAVAPASICAKLEHVYRRLRVNNSLAEVRGTSSEIWAAHTMPAVDLTHEVSVIHVTGGYLQM